jgi:hypothetical protein
MKPLILFFLVLIFFFQEIKGQSLPVGFPVLEEYLRRYQLRNFSSSDASFLLRPLQYENHPLLDSSLVSNKHSGVHLKILPILSTNQFNSKRPYGWGDFGMIPNVGFQQYLTGGITSKWKFIRFQFQPEFVIASNNTWFGYASDFPQHVNEARFEYWNKGDYPERYGVSKYSSFWWGQSKLSVEFGAFEIGAATQNIGWGPGQFNSLIFSNNPQGFAHLALNTIKPAKTFLGSFEGQLLSGRIDDSGFEPSQHPILNNEYFDPFSGDWKYVNALTIIYSPRWVPTLFLGFNRTFQVYREKMGDSFLDYFPVFSGVTKEKFFENGNSVEFDKGGADQQISISFRYVLPKSKFEFYGEFGRRDHAFNWREFILNPEHARAYLMGFKKLISMAKPNRFFQIRAEMTQQQESVNRYIRYLDFAGGLTWHTHTPSRAFANFGQALGVGIGVGSNVQTIEFAVVENFNKYGILLERLENHQDFYYRAGLNLTRHRPWVDLSLGFLFDKQWNNLLLRSKIQLVNGMNYQWQLDPKSTPDFPKGENLFSVHSQLSLIYLFNN